MSSPRPYSRARIPLLLGAMLVCLALLAYLLASLLDDSAWIGWVATLALIGTFSAVIVRMKFTKLMREERENQEGLIKLREGRFEEARRVFEKLAVETSSQHRTRLAVLHFNASVAGLRAGDVEAAQARLADLCALWLDQPRLRDLAPRLAAQEVLALVLVDRLDEAQAKLETYQSRFSGSAATSLVLPRCALWARRGRYQDVLREAEQQRPSVKAALGLHGVAVIDVLAAFGFAHVGDQYRTSEPSRDESDWPQCEYLGARWPDMADFLARRVSAAPGAEAGV